MKHIWLYLSSFGVMFAILSWLQETGILASVSELSWQKGVLAAALGVPLYFLIALRSGDKQKD